MKKKKVIEIVNPFWSYLLDRDNYSNLFDHLLNYRNIIEPEP